MKKYLLLAAFLFVLVLPDPAHAINLGGDLVNRAAGDAGYAAATETTLAEIIGEVIRTVLGFVGVIFLVLMVYAGFLWMNARGEESQIEKAQDIIRGSIIGLIITVGAYSITAFVVPRIVSKTAGPGSAGGSGAGPGGQVGCCLLENADGDVVSHLIVGSEDECEAGGFGGCVPGVNFDDCEFSWVATAAACQSQVPVERL